ncbi:hypothetical protein chiPu_0028447, partial [Chiloscyllium punctatum]|nr:hypothetical protein [Chiloscyllium punctatum]
FRHRHWLRVRRERVEQQVVAEGEEHARQVEDPVAGGSAGHGQGLPGLAADQHGHHPDVCAELPKPVESPVRAAEHVTGRKQNEGARYVSVLEVGEGGSRGEETRINTCALSPDCDPRSGSFRELPLARCPNDPSPPPPPDQEVPRRWFLKAAVSLRGGGEG